MALFGITVEVPLFLSFLSYMLTGSVFTNLIIYRTCYLSLGYNQSECALLGTIYNNETEKLEKLVEPQAAIINMTKSTIESVFSALMCLFIGPWSDKFGRIPVLITNLIGGTLTFVMVSIFSYFPNISPWYSIICSIPVICTGGAAVFLTIILSYITDMTNEENRGIRMAVFEAVLAGGALIGNICSSYLFYATNYVWVFAIAAGITALALLYVIFFIPESLHNQQTQGQLKDFFEVSNVIDMMKTTFKSRGDFARSIILLNLTILTVHIFTINGDGSVLFLFLREKFNWTLTKFTLFSSATSVTWIIGTMGGTYILHTLLHFKEPTLLLIGTVSIVIGASLQGMSKADWYLYTAGCIRCIGGVVSPMGRSLVSKLVPEHEIGKIFAMIMASEFFIGIFASPLYTAVYDATIKYDPGVFNYLTAGLFVVNIILIIVIILIQRFNSVVYSQLNNEEQQPRDITDNTIN